MATLEKIRKRSVLLFIVIIGALLAFILGDFLNSGRSFTGPGDTVAKAKGAKVDYHSYQERAKQASENAKNNPQTANMDGEVLNQQVIDQLLLEKLLEQEYASLGIDVTDNQISKIFFDPQYAPTTFNNLLSQFGQQGAGALYQAGIIDTRAYADAMKNPAKYKLTAEEGQILTQVWQNMEESLDQQLRQSAYMQVIAGLFNASEVDAKAVYNDRNTTDKFTYVRKDLSASKLTAKDLTDADYQAYYDAHKGMFKMREEARAVKAIVVPIQPSAADYEAGARENAQLLAELQNQEGTAALRAHSNFSTKSGKYTLASLKDDAQLRALAGADSAAAPLAVGTVRQLPMAPGSYAIAKVTGQTTGIDKVTFSAVTVPAESDSVYTSLTAATFDSIASSLGGRTAIELSLVNPTVQLTPKQLTALTENQVGEIFFINDTIEGQEASGATVKQVTKSAYLITKRDQPQTIYDITRADYTVVPSNTTIADLNQKLHAYVANNGNAESFVANAEKSGYTALDAVVSASTPSVGASRGSRNAVKWAMENGKGKVSHVFNNDNYLMALAVTEEFNGEYLPVNSKLVREQIEPAVLAEKRAQALIKEYSGKAKDVAGYASVMGETAANGESVFADATVKGVGFNEANLQGVVSGAAKGKVVGPFMSGHSVYVVQVTDKTQDGRPYNYQEAAQTYLQRALGAMMGSNQAMLQTLLGNEEYTNNILEFTSAE